MSGSARGRADRGSQQAPTTGGDGAHARLSPDERRDLLLHANDIVLLFDEGLRLVDCNDRAVEAYGRSREELLTRSIEDIRAQQSGIPLDERMPEVRATAGSIFESVHRREDGSTFPVEASVRTVETPHGLFYHATVRDITERKTAEAELQRAVLTSLGESIVTLDDAGRITYINHPEAGIDEQEVLGSKWVDRLDNATRAQAERALRATIETGEIQEIEFRVAEPERLSTWYHVRMVPLPGSSPASVVLVASDITKQRRTERDLRDALQRMRQAERTAHVGHWRVDARTGALEASDELLRIVGAPPDASGGDAESYVHPDDRAERRSVFEQVLAGEPYENHEWRTVRPDGAVRYLSGAADPVFDDAGNVVAVFGVTQDVTERAEALQAARETAGQYRALLENMLEGFAYCRMVWDEEGLPDDFIYLGVNPAFYRLTGLVEVVGKRVTEVLPDIKQHDPELFAIYGAVAATGEPADFDIHFAPLDKWLHVTATRPHEDEFVAFFSDVTERKEAERQARDSEQRLRLSLAAADAGIWEWDLRSGANTWSDEVWELYDLDRAQYPASYDAWLEAVHPDDREEAAASVSAAAAEGREIDLEYRVNTRDGSPRWLISRGSPERDGDGQGELVRYLGVVVDVTQRKLATIEAREREESYSAVFNEAPFGILVSRLRDAAIVSANRSFLELFECTLDEVEGGTIPDLGIASPEAIADMTAELGERGVVRDREVVRRRLTGGSVIFSINLARVSIGGEQHVVTTVRDITEARRAEQQLRESEERFRSLFEYSPIAVFFTSPDGGVNAANPAACKMFGYTEDQIVALGRSGLLDAEDPRLRVEVEQRDRTGRIQSAELTAIRSDGKRFPVEVDSVNVATEPPRAFVMMRDITERKRAEEALLRSEAEKQTALDGAELGVWMNDIASGGVRFDERGQAHYGFDARETTLDEVLARVHPDDVDRLSGEVAAALDPRTGTGEYATEYRVVPPDKPERWLSVSVRVLFEGDGEERRPVIGFGTSADITERKRMEEDLRRSEAEAREMVARLSLAQQLGHMGDWEWDVATGVVHWSDEVYRIYGVTPDFPTGFDAIVPMIHADDLEGHMARVRGFLDDGEASASFAFRIVRPDGTVRHVFQTAAAERDDEGRAVRLFGVQQDVTELREAEAALSESERRLRRFYTAGLVGVVFWTAEGAITDANDRYLEMVGYARDELEAGQVDWAAMTAPEWAARDRAALEELRTTGRNAAPFEKEYVRKDGTRLPILVTAATLDDEGRHGIALVLDISDQKRAENDLRRLNLELEERVRRRTADLEAANAELESFSYSVSHDLRAPLRHISGFAQLLAEHVGAGDEQSVHFVDVITRSAADMGTLIDDLLQFSRVARAHMHVELVDMARLVLEVLDVARGDLGERRVDVELGEILPAVGDQTLLRQVWANLIGNAFKYTRTREAAAIEIGSRSDAGEVIYWVRDNGVGFDMEYADRLFRVFERLHGSDQFEGSGIGLANVQRIVGRHGGHCWADAEEGVGATLFFALPAGTEE